MQLLLAACAPGVELLGVVVGAGVASPGAGVAPPGADVASPGAGVEPSGAGVAPPGAGVPVLGVGVAPSGAGVPTPGVALGPASQACEIYRKTIMGGANYNLWLAPLLPATETCKVVVPGPKCAQSGV